MRARKQILALGVDGSAPELWRIPGKADLKTAAQRHNAHVSRAPDEAICLDVPKGKMESPFCSHGRQVLWRYSLALLPSCAAYPACAARSLHSEPLPVTRRRAPW